MLVFVLHKLASGSNSVGRAQYNDTKHSCTHHTDTKHCKGIACTRLGKTKVGSITVPLTSSLTGLELAT